MQARWHTTERGSILIQVGVAILVLSAFLMFIVDYGIMWVSRNQAQNSADSGALAGAVALALDDNQDLTSDGPAQRAARGFALNNKVWGESPDVDFDTDIRFSVVDDDPNIFPGICLETGVNCIRVDVYRNQDRANPLPMWFGPLVGLTEQGVRATAIAWTRSGNASKCLKPWAIADKWIENNPEPSEWDPADTYDPTGETPDTYEPPTAEDPGSGFTVENDLGMEIRLKVGSPMDAINPGWFQALDLLDESPTGDNGEGEEEPGPGRGGGGGGGGGCGGGCLYRANIAGCVNRLYKVGDLIPKENGNMVGPTGQGAGDLIDLDPTADWDEDLDKVVGSCVETDSCVDAMGNPVQYSESPRIVAIPVFDLDHYMATGGPGNGTVKVVNILGFFVDRVEAPQNTVVGYLSSKVELYVDGEGEINEEAAFIKVIQLVR